MLSIKMILRDVSADPQGWEKLISTMAANYKYGFSRQLYIYAQKPQATACADIQLWNRLGRWVKKGAKGIALPKSEKGRIYVFDISDTHGKEVPLWKLDVLQDEEAVKAALQLPKQEPLRDSLLIGASEEAAAAAEEYWEEYLQRDSHPMTQEEMRELMEDTVCQMVMLRTGLEPLSTIRHKELLPEKGEWIGNTLSLCAQQILRQIETAVKHPERYLLAEPTANQEELQTDPEKDNLPEAAEKQEKPQPAAPNLSELPISRTGDTLIIGQEEKASKEVEITVTDEEWEAIQQAIPEKLAASEPEQETAARDPLSPAYLAGDQVYIENTLFEITQVSDREVQLLDPALVYPIFRSEPREYFDRLLQQDEKNRNITDFLSADLNRTDYDLREALVGDGGLMELKDKEIIAGHLRAGRGNDYIAQRLFHTFDGTTGTMTQITGSTLEYSADETGLQVQINDKTSTRKQITWAEISAVLRALFIQEQGGFLHEPEVSLPVGKSTTVEETNFFQEEDKKTEFPEKDPPSDFTSYQIYQLKEDPSLRDYRFLSLESMKKHGLEFSPENYNLIYSGTVEAGTTLDALYQKFNVDRPEDFTGHSLSVSDVVAIHTNGKWQAWYVDSIGFADVSREFYLTPESILPPQTTEIKENPAAGNYRITDPSLGEGGPKAKFRANMDAIYALKAIENQGRSAAKEEQEILSRYVGWGGLPEAFDPSKENWSKEYNQLKELLTPEEYTAARASTLNAHYTSPTVIRAIYQAVENMGFTTGNILEPSCGVGNFFGLLPEKMQDSRLYGVELDSITGRMAKQLYPQAEITVAGFETTRRMNFYDVAVGNVPFGQYQVNDPHYNRLGFPIHDYFFAKTIDQVRPGGIIAFVTSRYTLDKQGTEAREYIARRADLLGAIRLPNTAFKANAGTEVVSDILFLQKREIPRTDLPDWVYTGRTEEGFAINRYFLQHPEMVLGELSSESTQYGHEELTVIPKEGADLKELLENAVSQIHGQITPAVQQQDTLPEDGSLPADPAVRNFSYTLVDGEVYFQENSVMTRQSFTGREKERIRDALPVRDCLRRLIQIELEDGTDQQIKELQEELAQHYDRFVARNGYINTPANARVLRNDTSYPLLCSLERFNGQGQYEGKAEIFYKRTIKAQKAIDHVETAQEALTISVAEKAQVDMAYMSRLTGKREEELEQELQGKIFRDTSRIDGNETWKAAFTIETIQTLPWVTAEEYLSGNIRQKLRNVQKLSQLLQERKEHTEEEKAYFTPYITALKAVQPKDLGPEEIHVRLGATWIPVKDIQDFAYETFRTPFWAQRNIQIEYSPYTAAWQIRGKGSDNGNVMVTKTFGTNRKNAWELLEDTLNLRDAQVYDYVERDGTRQAVPNPKETQLAQEKQEGIKRTFREWLWKDPKRRERLCAAYNEQFNSIRLREYDGSSIPFTGINPEIRLRPHQQNAAARIILGGNTLLAHVVGAGKTYTAIAAAMESRRLGLCQKPLFVVPNHLTEQWADDFLRLYPAANILAATKKDFEKENRQKFCSRIATGDWDAVIIGHSQFEKLPLSPERQRMMLQQQEDELISAIADAKGQEGQQFSVKQMEKSRKSLQVKLEKLNDQSRKDGVITFEEMGIDRLFVDEAHSFKNLFLNTKMRNVAGIAQSEAMKSSDLFMKCRYLDELTHGKGIIFATGTPVSNTMAELYTMQRYLQMNTLKEAHMENFDSWAANFGETVTALEISPEGYTLIGR